MSFREILCDLRKGNELTRERLLSAAERLEKLQAECKAGPTDRVTRLRDLLLRLAGVWGENPAGRLRRALGGLLDRLLKHWHKTWCGRLIGSTEKLLAGWLDSVSRWQKELSKPARSKLNRVLWIEPLERRVLLTGNIYWYPTGNGPWSWSGAYWSSSSTGGNTAAWTTADNGDTAVFSGTSGGTVIVDASTISVGGIQFNTGGYTIAPSQSTNYSLGLATGGATIGLSGGVTAQITAQITGGNLTVSGGGSGGILQLAPSSSYPNGFGNLTISGATLQANTGGALPNGTVTLGTSGSLVLNASQSIGGLYCGVSGGSVVLNNSAGLTINAPGSGDIFSGAVSGAGTGGLTVGSNTLILTGANSYTGPTAVSGGATLQLGNGSSGGGSLSNSTTVYDYGTLLLCPSASMNFPNIITGGGGQVIIGLPGGTNGGTVTLGTNNYYSGGTTIDCGTLAAGSLGTGGLTINGGGLQVTASFTLSEGIVVAESAATIAVNSGCTLTVASGITGGNGITGSSNLTISSSGGSSGGTFVLSGGSSTYPGAMIINGAAVSAGTQGVLPSGPVTLENSGVLTLNASQSISGLSGGGSGGGVVLNNSAGLTVSPTASDTFAGVISNSGGGSGGLTVNGDSTLVLTAANTYTGPTTINAGATLQLGNGSSGGGALSSSTTIYDYGNLALCPAAALSFSNAISGGSGQVSIGVAGGAGGGTVTLGGLQSYETTAIYSGTLQVSGANSFGGNLVTINGGALDATGSVSLSQSISLASSASTIEVQPGYTLAVTGSIGGNGGLSLSEGSGGSGASSSLILAGPSSYSGTTNIAYGTTLQLGNGSGSFAFTNSNAINDGGTLALWATPAGWTLQNTISGVGGVTVLGSSTGSVTLAPAALVNNSYLGGTTVDAGKLIAGNAFGLTSGTVVNVSGGGVQIDGNQTSDGIFGAWTSYINLCVCVKITCTN